MPEKLVTIATFSTLVEATMSKNHLDDEGIKAVLADSEAVSMSWHLTSAFGGIKLQVMDEDVERAVSILESADIESIDDDGLWLDESREDFEQDFSETCEDKYVSPSRELVTNALRSAILGLIFLPLQFYSLWLLLRIAQDGEPLSSTERVSVLITVILDAGMLILIALLFWSALSR